MNNEVIETKILEHDDKIKEHDTKINNLEKSDVKHDDNISQLCEKIDGLIQQNSKLLYAVLVGMAGILVKILFFK
ncbi:hypothetical protein CPAST_c34580 [Clostridium pasteurianum DSM 525 = ATCC 6013]|uniref:Hemolysin XhlA n=1 Tax=Clostridium pasteurianum DSM 525 = ATCC 6013 TaxID=1262449 RepID=A0A0H3J7R8_CLOPA|nr:hypothetical protein [Clostridium pasteurianum]AJA49519.1 hypothetical protein CPAST_c34580 [Clostridium pasteurianum DSM 525 = ATCC 6013]AJA53507.1 hypothetical protein CLPA_c34580 [Clostridium pasteurianum DSM 525 = ATCC 6013]AOZ76680.1 hypothetical protein AQ983_16800 [Clostridium pasteurianum DSM 525 = ATCC 6013]AOZ80477.1 hypothetical protein AQ984_16795 [Clostridium pasteurianum]ELP58962.1 hypothetical protein F502_12576 [Clostridium pasteurianum DSM 525 = ATCC 6013]